MSDKEKGDGKVVELQPPRRLVATDEDMRAVGTLLDDLKAAFDKGEIGTIVLCYLSPNRENVKTAFMKLPGSSHLELMGMAEFLKHRIEDNYK